MAAAYEISFEPCARRIRVEFNGVWVADSSLAPILRGAGGVRRRLEDPQCKLDYPVVRDLHAEGASDYVAMPFRFADGQLNVLSMTSFTPGGFSSAHLG